MRTYALPVLDETTRRQLLWGVSGTALLGLTACAPSAEPGAGSTARPAAATRLFIDDTGTEVDVPARPQRVVALVDLLGARLLALGVPVLAMPTVGETFRPEISELFDLSDVDSLGVAGAEPDLEALAGLSPDLIVVGAARGEHFLDPGTLELLSAIAPVAALETFVGVETATTRAAELAGEAVTVDTAALQAEFEEALEELTAALGGEPAQLDVCVMRFDDPATLYVWGPTAVPPTDVLRRAGVAWVDIAQQAEAGAGDVQLSAEQLEQVSGDLLVVTTAFQADDADNPIDLPVFAALPVVRAGQVVDLDRSYFGVTYPTYTAFARWMTTRLQELQPLRTDVTA